MKPPVDPDLVLGANGRIYANASSMSLADRHGRRVLRVVELTPGEEEDIRGRLGALASDLLVGLAAAKRGAQ